MQKWRTHQLRRRGMCVVVTTALMGLSFSTFAAEAKLAKPVIGQTGMFLSHCVFSHRAPSDPIVHPKMTGSHSHDFFGNLTTNADSTTSSLQNQGTSCQVLGDTAAYWVPTLYANGTAIEAADSLSYYRTYSSGSIATMPIGLKIVAGGADHVRWTCFSHGMGSALANSPRPCRSDERVAMGVTFPECWNGSALDSADHRSHMAYAVDHVCPNGFPTVVPRLALWILYKPFQKGSTLSFSSGGVETAHADFFNAWDKNVQQKLHTYCLDGHRICYKTMYRIMKLLGLARKLPTKTQPIPTTEGQDPGPDSAGQV